MSFIKGFEKTADAAMALAGGLSKAKSLVAPAIGLVKRNPLKATAGVAGALGFAAGSKKSDKPV